MQIFWHQRSHQPENESQSTEALSTRQQKVSVRIFWRVCVCKKRFRQGIATLSSQEKHLTGASGWNFKPFVRVGRSVFACVRLHVCAWDGLQPIENICRKINCSGMKRVRARTPLRDGPAWKPSGLQQQRPPKERERARERAVRIVNTPAEAIYPSRFAGQNLHSAFCLGVRQRIIGTAGVGGEREKKNWLPHSESSNSHSLRQNGFDFMSTDTFHSTAYTRGVNIACVFSHLFFVRTLERFYHPMVLFKFKKSTFSNKIFPIEIIVDPK